MTEKVVLKTAPFKYQRKKVVEIKIEIEVGEALTSISGKRLEVKLGPELGEDSLFAIPIVASVASPITRGYISQSLMKS